MEPTVEPRIDWILQVIDLVFLALSVVTNFVSTQFQPFFESIINELLRVLQPAGTP